MIITSPQDLANTVKDLWHIELTQRPWNLYKPKDTFWWLVPSTDWPAYRYGKFAFSLAHDAPRNVFLASNDPVLGGDTIFAGLNIEKGYGDKANVFDPALGRKGQIMDEDWLWHKAVNNPGSGQFDDMIAEVSVSSEIFLYVISSYLHDRDSTAQHQADGVMFSCHSSGISSVLHNHFPINALRGIDEAKDFKAVAAHLRTINDLFWVDMYLGTHVAKGEIDIQNLYRNVLSPFVEWVR